MYTAFLLFVTYMIPVIFCQETTDSPVDVLKVKNLKLENYHGRIDSEMLKLFKSVEIFEIRNSNLTPISDNFFHSVPNLKKFSIINTFAERENDDMSTCCWNLKDLELINSGFSSVPWEKMDAHWPIERLFLSKENIPNLEGNFLQTKLLKDFTIEYSDLETIENDAFNGLVNIESLNLQGNKLKQINKEVFAPLTKLKVLNLRKNLLEKLTTDQFPSLPNLEVLDVRQNNHIEEIDLTGIKTLAPNLKEVRIPMLVGVELGKAGGVKLVLDFL